MFHVLDAGIMPYRPAWDLQLKLHEQVLSGEHVAGVLMLVEHPPVVTIGRRADAERNLLASPRMLEARGVEVVETDRGGDITFHGPGQLVAYPIVPLNTYNLNLHSYMRFLEEAVIQTLARFGVEGMRDPSPKPATGVWVEETRNAKHETRNVTQETGNANDEMGTGDRLAKICALGIKVRRWVTLHGIALNVTTDLSFFDLINPCGLSRPVTSMRRVLGEGCPVIGDVKAGFAEVFRELLGRCPATPALREGAG